MSHEIAGNVLTRDVMGGSGIEGSALKMAYAHSYWQEASVLHHTASVGLLEHSHDMAAGFP